MVAWLFLSKLSKGFVCVMTDRNNIFSYIQLPWLHVIQIKIRRNTHSFNLASTFKILFQSIYSTITISYMGFPM